MWKNKQTEKQRHSYEETRQNINGEIHVNKHENNQCRNPCEWIWKQSMDKLKPITSYCGAFVRIQSFDVPIKVQKKKKITSFFVSNFQQFEKTHSKEYLKKTLQQEKRRSQSNLQFKGYLFPSNSLAPCTTISHANVWDMNWWELII